MPSFYSFKLDAMSKQSPIQERKGSAAKTVSLFRRLDYLPPWAAVLLGIAGAALIIWLVTGLSWKFAVVLVAAVLAGSVWTACQAQPVAEISSLMAQPFSRQIITALPDLELINLPGGAFTMGSPVEEEGRYADEGPLHQVMLSPFALMDVPVTRRLYVEVVGSDPAYHDVESDQRPEGSN